MSRTLSLDLRERVIAAIEEGASCREAAERFSVGVATAIRWRASFRAEGEITAKPMGGDRHSHRTEAHSAVILNAYQARPQIYLREVRDVSGVERRHGEPECTVALLPTSRHHP